MASAYLKGPARQLARQLLGYPNVATSQAKRRHFQIWNSLQLQSRATKSTFLTLSRPITSATSTKATTVHRLDSNFHPISEERRTKGGRRPKLQAPTRPEVVDDFRRENHFVYRYVHKNVKDYAPSELILDELPITAKIKEFKHYLDANTEHNHVRSAKIAEMYDSIRKSINTLNQQELAVLMLTLSKETHREFLPIWRFIDIELRWLVKQHVRTRLMDLNLWLYLTDIYYSVSMVSKFASVLLNYISSEEQIQMNNRQLVHLLFLVIQRRENYGILDKYKSDILNIVKKGTFEDLVTVCMAYHKTKTQMPGDGLITTVLSRLLEFLPRVDPKEPGYCGIIKCIRYSSRNSNVNDRDLINKLVKLLVSENKNIIFASAHNAIHTVKLMESFKVYDAQLLETVSDSILGESDKFRIKDIQYLMSSLSNLAYNNLQLTDKLRAYLDKFCENIANESRPDTMYQTAHLVPILRSFVLFQYYNEDFLKYLNKALKPENYQIFEEVLEYDRSLLLAYAATRIDDCPIKLADCSPAGDEYFLNLSKKVGRMGDTGIMSGPNSKLGHLNLILNDPIGDHKGKTLTWTVIFRRLGRMLAQHPELRRHNLTFSFQFTLPHQNFADMIISRDCQPPGDFDPKTLEPAPVIEGQRQCLVFGLRKQHDYIGVGAVLGGYKKMVSRLLSKLGYKIVYVDFSEHNIDETVREIKAALDLN